MGYQNLRVTGIVPPCIERDRFELMGEMPQCIDEKRLVECAAYQGPTGVSNRYTIQVELCVIDLCPVKGEREFCGYFAALTSRNKSE